MYQIIYFPLDYNFPDNVNPSNQEQLSKYYLENKATIEKSDEYFAMYESIQDFLAAFSDEEISDLGAVCIVPKEYSNIEELIDDNLPPIIETVMQQIYTNDFKITEEFKSNKTKFEALGIIVSKYCRWDIGDIMEIMNAALEYSNYNPVEAARKTLENAGYIVDGLWSREDITMKAEEMSIELTPNQLESVYIKMGGHDTEYGINWQFIADCIREVAKESKPLSHEKR